MEYALERHFESLMIDIRNAKLEMTEKLVLILLATRIESEKNIVIIDYKQMALDSGATARIVKRAVQKLIERGYLILYKKKCGENKPNEYKIII